MTRPQEPNESFTQSDFAAVGIELLVRQRRIGPPTEPGFSQGSIFSFLGENVLAWTSNMRFVNKDKVYFKICFAVFEDGRSIGSAAVQNSLHPQRVPDRGQIFWNLPLALMSDVKQDIICVG